MASDSYAKLVVEQGPIPGQEIELRQPECTIGRDATQDLALDATGVSRRHARVFQRGGQALLEDLGSSNGTFINGERIVSPTPINPGDEIRLGKSVRLRFVGPPQAQKTQPLEDDPLATRVEAAHETRVVAQPDLPGAEEAAAPPAEPTAQAAPLPSPPGSQPPPQLEPALPPTAVAAPPPQTPNPPTPSAPRAPAAVLLPPDAGGTPPLPPASQVSETVIGDERAFQAEQAPRLKIAFAGAQPQVYLLRGERITIGRAEDNDIVIPFKIVSSHHGVIEKRDNIYTFRSLPDVTNPVFFGGRALQGVVALRSGDLLRIGSADPGLMVTIEYQDQAAAHLAPPIQFGAHNQAHIGRDPSNEVALAAPTISRFHASIEKIGARFRVRDLNSSNGTFVNDQRIEGETWLSPGDSIRVGPYRFALGEDQLSQVEQADGMRVEIVGLNKWVRPDLNLLKDISLIFKPREFVVVVGQSGGGKSTLLDAVAGFRPATHGKVFVNDIDIYRNFDAIRNEIGFVPQKDIIHMELTAYQALDFAAQLRMPADTSAEERHQRIMEVLQDLDLLHRKDVQISGLSGGQQKRVSIGVELLTKPGLFFLDEPTSGLDPGTETALMQLMRRLADQGRTIVLITHATKNVMLADKVVFLARGGYIAWFGPPNEALEYFDRFRSERERHARAMEFDQIYAILDDPAQGKAEDWAERFRQLPAYQEYIVQPLNALGRALPGRAGVQAQEREAVFQPARRPRRNQVSGLRQFMILSTRNIKILMRDRASLFLMLISAPLVAMLDVLLAVILGRDLFSFADGDMANAVTSLFQPIIFAIMVGGLSQMREFVKEADIYRRERLVNLKVFPYVFSKLWVAALLALYQAAAYTIIHYLAFKMPGGALEFGIFYFTLTLATFSGMMLGLLASAVAPNANAAPLIVILLIIPQVVVGGALIPMPPEVSAATLSRWSFQGLIASSGAGSDVAADACWDLPQATRNDMSLDDKLAQGCLCLGPNALREQFCNFPGLGEYYDEALDTPKPVEPQEIGEPPPEPEIPPAPESPADPNDRIAVAQYLQALDDYQKEVQRIQDDYKAAVNDYQARADLYKAEAAAYQKELTEWEISRNAAVGKAEGVIEQFNDNFGWAFVDKKDGAVYWSTIAFTWIVQGAMILFIIALILFFIYRKDKAK